MCAEERHRGMSLDEMILRPDFALLDAIQSLEMLRFWRVKEGTLELEQETRTEMTLALADLRRCHAAIVLEREA